MMPRPVRKRGLRTASRRTRSLHIVILFCFAGASTDDACRRELRELMELLAAVARCAAATARSGTE